MPSQFFGLNIAYTGLLASNAAMNTTSNNIANVQTTGYSRQQVSQQAAGALRVFQTYGCAGAGVETLAVERVRDEFYDFRYWNNNQRVGEYGQKQYYMQQIEAYFDDNGQNAGFKTVFNQMMITGMQELLKNPDDSAAKKQFVGTAGALAEYFNGLAGNLEKLQKDVNQEIKIKVDEINSLASEIATLNKQINTIEISGAASGMKANELRDRRELLIDQLSEIVDVEVKEIPIMDNNNADRVTGANRYMVKIAGGQVLVDGNEYNGLECKSRESYEKVNQTDVDGLYDVYWKNGDKFNLHNGAMGGALKGLVDLRDGNNGESFKGLITGVGDTTVNGKVHDTVTIEVGLHYLTDLNRCNLSDQGGVINLGGREYYYDSWEYSVTYENGEPVYSYTFTLSDSELNSQKLTNDRVGKTASVGNSVSYQGVPYYMAQMNEWVRVFSQKFNDILKSGVAGKEPGIGLFTADMPSEGQYVYENYADETVDQYLARVEDLRKLNPGMTETEARLQAIGDYRYDKESEAAYKDRVAKLTAPNKDGSVSSISQADAEAAAVLRISVGRNDADDSYFLMTAANFAVSNTIENDPDRLATRREPADGVEQNDLLEDLNDLATNKDKMSFRGSSASEFLQCILSDVALNTSRAETFYKSFLDVAYTVDTQRLSISGVDEDEEALNLVKFQQGYNLACQMIQTLSEIYDRLILQTGV